MKFSGNHAFTGTDTITGTGTGIVEFSSGTISIGSTYDVAGGTTVSVASVTVASTATLTKLGGTLTISSGSLDLGAKSTTADAFVLSGGSFNGTGTLTTATMTWNGGSMTGTGTTAVTTSLEMSGGQVLTGRTLTSSGATTLSGSGSLTGTGIFNNSGTLTKSSTGTSSISLLNGGAVNFTNTGAVSVTGGALEINMSSGSHGPYAVSSGATLRFTGSHTFMDAANEIISGAGTVEFSAGTIDVNSSYGPVGSTVVSGANATFSKLATSTGPFSISAGTLKFSGNHEFTGTDTITGTGAGKVEFVSGEVLVSNSYEISGLTSVSGATVILSNLAPSTGAFNVSSGLLRFSGSHTFETGANITGTGIGSIEFDFGNIVVNSTYDVAYATTISGAAVTIAPAGLVKLGGTLTISGSGSLDLSSAAANIAALNLTGGSLTGSGTLSTTNMNWSGGTMSGGGVTQVSGSLALSGDRDLTGRTLNILAGGTAHWTANGSLTGSGTFINHRDSLPDYRDNHLDFWNHVHEFWPGLG